MEETKKLTRRQFAGALAVAAAAASVLLAAEPQRGQRKKEAKPEAKPPEPTAEERRERAAKQIREFRVAEGAEPAFAFRAEWNHPSSR
jgi:hypothetical protein